MDLLKSGLKIKKSVFLISFSEGLKAKENAVETMIWSPVNHLPFDIHLYKFLAPLN